MPLTDPAPPVPEATAQLELEGQVAVVTGASRGIGRACALALASRGARVVALGRQSAGLEALASEIEARGLPTAQPLVCDVAEPDQVKLAFQQVFKQFKRLDMLVANAGIMEDAVIGMVTPDLVQRVFATNTHGLIWCAQYASRLMARSGGGRIVAMASLVGEQGHAGQAVYAGSKAAIAGIVRSLSQELAPQQIRVNAVAPGFIDTELTRHLPEARRAAVCSGIPLGRAGTPEDVADVVTFLLGEPSRYVTGQVIGVDGGLHF